MNRDFTVLASIIVVVFGALILFSNPIEFHQFPVNVAVYSWLGLALFIGGLFGAYYAFK